MKPRRILFGALPSLAFLAFVIAPTAPASAATPQEKVLAAKLVKLQKQLNQARITSTGLRKTLATRTSERDAARASLRVCQLGVQPAISTMTPVGVMRDLAPVLVRVFDGHTDAFGDDGYYDSSSFHTTQDVNGLVESSSLSLSVGGLAASGPNSWAQG